jgi:hypothetical protein
MGVGALGFSLFCLYDGFIRYPAKRADKFEVFKLERAKSQPETMFSRGENRAMSFEEFDGIADEYHRNIWDQFVHDVDVPTTPKIFAQFVMAAGTALIGVALLWGPIRSRGRWIEAGPEGLTSSWGESFRFDEVEVVNKRAWRKKGIARVTYVSGGRRRTFVIDDFKFQRWPTDAILYVLEQRIDHGRIINGPAEPEPEPDGKVAEILGASNGSEPSA